MDSKIICQVAIVAPVSWSGGDRVAIVSDDILTDEQKVEIMASRAVESKGAQK